MRILCVALGVACLTSGLLFADDPKTTPDSRGSLPQHWSKLGLSDEQKQKAYAIDTEYHAKIEALELQIKKLREQKGDELTKVLTGQQQARLQEILTSNARWILLFLADDPSVWDTDSRQPEKFAVPVAWAPAFRYLRLRRMDTGEALIVPLTADQLKNGKPPSSEEGFWWNGTSKKDWEGRHLGIAQGPRYKFPAPKGVIHVMTEGWDGFAGSGFGHKCFVNDKQYYCWQGKEIGRTVFEIAVSEGPLGAEESRSLLRGP
jgi:hypothetical protein